VCQNFHCQILNVLQGEIPGAVQREEEGEESKAEQACLEESRSWTLLYLALCCRTSVGFAMLSKNATTSFKNNVHRAYSKY
jgi:hypothetical protein